MLLRIIRIAFGVLLMAHGLVHLVFYPGAAAAEGGRLLWNGTAQFGSELPPTELVGHALVVATVILFVAAGLSTIVRKLLPLAGYFTATASALSLAVTWWMWPGLEPDPSNFWRGPVISAVTLAVSPVIVLAGRDATRLRGSWFARSYFATGGTTAFERAEEFACDALMPDAPCVFYRAIDIDAAPATVYRWLGMIRKAPYSYDLLDNRGRRSPRRLDESLPPLAPGQAVLGMFTVVEVDEGRGFTATSEREPASAISYRCTHHPDGTTRLVVKLLARCRTELGGMLLGVCDLIMMRKQLRTLARLSWRSEVALANR